MPYFSMGESQYIHRYILKLENLKIEVGDSEKESTEFVGSVTR